MLFFGIAFFVIGILYVGRTGIFLFDQSSKANIVAGKIIYWGLEIGIRIMALSFVVFLQIFNVIMFSLIVQGIAFGSITIPYAFTIILSFVGMIPVTWSVLVRLRKQVRRWDWVAVIIFMSPWLVLIASAILSIVGIRLV